MQKVPFVRERIAGVILRNNLKMCGSASKTIELLAHTVNFEGEKVDLRKTELKIMHQYQP